VKLLDNLKYRKYKRRKRREYRVRYIDPQAQIDPTANIYASEIHSKVNVDKNATIHGCLISGQIDIGKNTSLWGPNIHVLSEIEPITIGNFCSIARDVTIQEYFHDHKKLSTYFIGRNVFGEPIQKEVRSKGPITIGSDVWIGTGAQIMSGVTVGHGAVLGANTTITKDVPPYAIVAGVPGRVIGYRFSDEIIAKLLKIQWWNWDNNKIKQHQELFESELTISMLDNIQQ
jgi:virginiamycin A acetyltransferase